MPCGDRLAWLSLATPSQRPELASVDFNDADAALPADMPLAHLAGDLTGERWLTDDTPRDVTIAGWQVRATTHLAMASRFFAEDADESVADIAYRAYHDLATIQNQTGLAYPQRIWHVLSDVVGGNGEAQRYRRFCRGRAEALAAFETTAAAAWQSLPPATLVGGARPGLWIQALLGDTPVIPIENPRQTSAWAYPRRYSENAPAFARAGIITAGHTRFLMISGTAAIVGHESCHPGDVLAQFDEALCNVRAVMAAAAPEIGAHELDDLVCLKLYVRHPEDAQRLLGHARRRLPEMPMAALAATVCRSELLVELEAHLRVAD